MINIYYCTDNKFFKQQVISLISLAGTTKEELNVINLTAEIPEYNPKSKKTSKEQDALCTKILQESNPKSRFHSIDVSDLMREHLLKGPNLDNKYYKFSAYVSVRLLAHMIPEIPDKILYVDADVLFPGDVKELYDMDISDVEVAGRRDAWRISRYIQSGVMLLNMKKIRESGMFDSALHLVQTKKYICYIDMSAINTASKAKRLFSKKYNTYKWTKDAVVHHVCGLREGKIPFTKKWWHRIKIDEVDMAKEKMPQYHDVYEKFETIQKNNPELF